MGGLWLPEGSVGSDLRIGIRHQALASKALSFMR